LHQVRISDSRWALPTAPAEPDSFEVQEEGAEESAAPAAQTVAGVYRALRKAREDSKDASGASDFYYGEMEMRRKHERGALLLVYWLLSGYGTRAGRALLAYGAVVGLISLLLHSFGFEGVRPDWARTFSFALTSTVFVGHVPGQGITPFGDVLQLALRVLGPLLLGLSLLALRTRVQR
jgi:hypothetical protein